MSEALRAVLRRRAQLQARSQAQRAAVSVHAAAMCRPLALADRVSARARRLAVHPVWVGVLIAGSVAALVAAGPRRSLRWAGRALSAWRLWLQIKGAFAGGATGTARPSQTPPA